MPCGRPGGPGPHRPDSRARSPPKAHPYTGCGSQTRCPRRGPRVGHQCTSDSVACLLLSAPRLHNERWERLTPVVSNEACGAELDRMLLTQAGNCVAVVTDLLQQ